MCKIAGDETMIRRLTAGTRRTLVECRALAMHGEAEAAFNRIDNWLSSAGHCLGTRDTIAMLTLKAEILYLNNDREKALAVFRADIRPLLESVDDDARDLVLENESVVAINLFEPSGVAGFYRLVDYRRLSGWHGRDSDAILAADEAARDNRHFEALPAYWRQVRDAYLSGSWGRQRSASARFARECLQLGWLPRATYYCLLAEDDKLSQCIGAHLLTAQKADLVAQTVETLLQCASLIKHARTACIVLTNIADAIPDEQLDEVFDWVCGLCKVDSHRWGHSDGIEKTWTTATTLSARFTPEQSQELADIAVAHTVWGSRTPHRKHLLAAVTQCARMIPPENLDRLAEVSLPLAKDRKSDFDYFDVVELLCQIADRASPQTKATMADALYPTDSRSTSAVLLQVADTFGKRVTGDKSELSMLARKVASNIRLQVQRLSKGQEPKPVAETYLTVTAEKDEEVAVANVVGTVQLEAVVKYADEIDEPALADLLDAMIQMIKNSDNMMCNRVSLAATLRKLARRLNETQADVVFSLLDPIASGIVTESEIGMKNADAANPLNPYKMGDNTPEELTAVAIYTLATIEKEKRGTCGARLAGILERSLNATSPEIRRAAFAAARELPALSEAVLTGVLFGTRDSDAKVAAMAFDVIAARDLDLQMGHFGLLSYSMHAAVMSPDRELRRQASRAVSRLMPKVPPSLAEQFRVIAQTFAGDICHSVRQAAVGTTL
jgi:hypothetical protein